MKQGFTLVELVIVIVIIGILASIALTGYTNQTYRANYAKVVMDMEAIESVARAFMAQNENWPHDSLPDRTEPVDGSIGLNISLAKMPTPPCKGWLYDWDNWKDLAVYNPDGSINGERSEWHTVRITLRSSALDPTETLRTAAYYKCLTSDSEEKCSESDRLWAGDGQNILAVADKKITCKVDGE